MFEQKWAKLMQSSNAHQSWSFQEISKFFMWSCRKKLVYKTAISDFQNFGFAKNNIQKLTFCENWFFLHFQKFKKPEYVLDHYMYSARADQISGRYHFGSHFITLKRWCQSDGSMVPTHWGLDFGISSSMSFYALPFLCGLVEKR